VPEKRATTEKRLWSHSFLLLSLHLPESHYRLSGDVSMDRLLRTKEAARLIGLSASFLNQRRVKGGGPPYAKVGRVVLYDPSELLAWAKNQTRRSTSGPSG
jgi:predicted DNA-binding transcriptional regulator AlpA